MENNIGCVPAQQKAMLDTMLDELIERARKVKRLAEKVNMALYSEKIRVEQESMKRVSEPADPSQYPINTVLGVIELADNILGEASNNLEGILSRLSEIVGEAGILF